MATAAYTSEHITVLEGLEPVRRRPGMYIGGTDTKGYHHLLWEIVDNSVDEVINAFATHIQVTLHKDAKSVTVVDDGRGIPIDVKKEFKKSALELVLTTLTREAMPVLRYRTRDLTSMVRDTCACGTERVRVEQPDRPRLREGRPELGHGHDLRRQDEPDRRRRRRPAHRRLGRRSTRPRHRARAR